MKRCPKCGNETFEVNAHVVQGWLVNNQGEFVSVTEECVDVAHDPDQDDIWVCAKCGYEATGKDFEVSEPKEISPIKKALKARFVELLNTDMSGCEGDYAEEMAEYLISQGATLNSSVKVHCEECQYYNAKKSRCDHPQLEWDVECFDHWLEVQPTDFCSYGIPKNQN